LEGGKHLETAQTKLASIRRYHNLSQREMAEVLNIKTESYSNKERGVTQFKSSEMFIISDYFEMKVDDIFLPPNFIKHEVI